MNDLRRNETHYDIHNNQSAEFDAAAEWADRVFEFGHFAESREEIEWHTTEFILNPMTRSDDGELEWGLVEEVAWAFLRYENEIGEVINRDLFEKVSAEKDVDGRQLFRWAKIDDSGGRPFSVCISPRIDPGSIYKGIAWNLGIEVAAVASAFETATRSDPKIAINSTDKMMGEDS
jgi:hypothetical protein